MLLDWKPCRVVHCYKIVDGITYIVGFDGIITLNKTATIIWKMVNGKNTVKEIVVQLKKIYIGVDEKILLNDVERVINSLSARGAVIKDWDPLLKDNISYKEDYENE